MALYNQQAFYDNPARRFDGSFTGIISMGAFLG